MPKYSDLNDIPADVFKEYVLEGRHGSWDGWTEEEGKVLDRMVNDLELYAKSQ